MLTKSPYGAHMNKRHFTTSLMAATFLGACRGDNSHSLIGKALPTIKGTFTDGAGFDLSKITKPSVIRFWGMWCGPCMVDMPNWLSVVRQLRVGEKAIDKINIFTIHVGVPPETGETLAQWTAAQAPDVATPVVDDTSYAIMKAVGVMGTPSTLYIDEIGRIQEHAWEFKNERGVDSFLRKVGELHARGPR